MKMKSSLIALFRKKHFIDIILEYFAGIFIILEVDSEMKLKEGNDLVAQKQARRFWRDGWT